MYIPEFLEFQIVVGLDLYQVKPNCSRTQLLKMDFKVKRAHVLLEHVHLCTGIARFSMKSIFKSWFLEKIWLYRNKIDVFVVFTLQYFWQMQFGRRNQKIIFPKDFGIQRSRWCCYHFVIENIVCLMTPRLLEVSANSIGFCQEIAELSGIPLFQPNEWKGFFLIHDN